MFLAVLRVEWSSALRERSLFVVMALFSAAIAIAALGSRQFVDAERRQMTVTAREEAARFAALAAEAEAIRAGGPVNHNANPTVPLAVGQELLPRAASLPLAPLAPLAIGQRDLRPQTLQVTTKARVSIGAEADTVSPARRASGPFDLAFVLVFLLPLAIIATSFDLLSAERERGTLALVLSQPISLTTFVLGKVTLRALLMFAFTVLVAVAGVLVAGARISESGGAAALALSIALLLGYASFWFALALAVNAWGRSSAANALALVAAWLAFVVVVPGLGSVAVDTLYPSPSRVELVDLTREAAREANDRASQIEGDHGRPQGESRTMRRALEVQEDIEHRVHPVLEGFEERLAEQQALVDRLRFASPALLLNEGLNDVAGSGVARHQHFTAQVDAFHEDLERFFHAKVESGATLGAADYDAMPRFRHVEPGLDVAAARVIASIAGMLAMAALMIGLALAGLRKNVNRGLR